jgi:hypothetical protein
MRRYFAEFNRVVGDNIRGAARSLRRFGLDTTVLPHRTALLIERPSSMSWGDFKNAIRAVLQPRRGSVIISSEATGRTFICQNSSNRPGVFKRQ